MSINSRPILNGAALLFTEDGEPDFIVVEGGRVLEIGAPTLALIRAALDACEPWGRVERKRYEYRPMGVLIDLSA